MGITISKQTKCSDTYTPICVDRLSMAIIEEAPVPGQPEDVARALAEYYFGFESAAIRNDQTGTVLA